MGVCPGASPGNASASLCPFASVRFAVKDSEKFEPSLLPTFLGGTCRCIALGGCVAYTPNERKAPAGDADAAAGATTITVPGGAHHDIPLVARAPGDRLVWEFAIADMGLEFSAAVAPEAGPPLLLVPPKKYRKEDGTVAGSVVVPVAVRRCRVLRAQCGADTSRACVRCVRRAR